MMQRMDVFLSIGPKCRPISYLRDSELTWFASPIDWQILPSLNTVLYLFESRFSDFFLNIRELESKEESSSRVVLDVKNDVKSMHHFKKELTLKAGQIYVRNRARIRFKNTDGALKEAASIGLLGNWNVSVDELIGFLESFSKLYPNKKMTLYNIHHSPEVSVFRKVETIVSSKLLIVEYFFCDEGSRLDEAWKGNQVYWNQIVGEFALSPESLKRRNAICQKF